MNPDPVKRPARREPMPRLQMLRLLLFVLTWIALIWLSGCATAKPVYEFLPGSCPKPPTVSLPPPFPPGHFVQPLSDWLELLRMPKP